jgi:signal transduction histidine kinase
VRQALSNILDNALRHTPGGGTVRIQVGREENAALLEVADTGPGFRGDLLPVALEPFVRDDAARGRVEGGAGLGLAIVRAVAEAHGGSVSIRNEPGGGAAVLLRLPD